MIVKDLVEKLLKLPQDGNILLECNFEACGIEYEENFEIKRVTTKDFIITQRL